MRRLLAALLAAAVVVALPAARAADDVVNVYSARHDTLIKPLLDRFSKQTGIAVGLVTGNSDAMIKRLQVEGRNTPADVLITVDVARLGRAARAGLFQPVRSDRLETAIPAPFRDPDGLWFGLSMRARVIAYSRERVDPASLSTYEALTDNRWDDRICIRSSDNVYNQSLLASIVAAHDEHYAAQWARGIVDNMARRPQGGDTAQIQAVAAGVCDVAVVNTYYYARMITADKGTEARAAAEKVGLFFPNQDGRGAHVNVSGAGVLRHARHKDAAVRLLEYLASPEAQTWLGQANYEYPVNPDGEVSDVVRNLGHYPFKRDDVPLARLGELNATAVRIFDRAGWR